MPWDCLVWGLGCPYWHLPTVLSPLQTSWLRGTLWTLVCYPCNARFQCSSFPLSWVLVRWLIQYPVSFFKALSLFGEIHRYPNGWSSRSEKFPSWLLERPKGSSEPITELRLPSPWLLGSEDLCSIHQTLLGLWDTQDGKEESQC